VKVIIDTNGLMVPFQFNVDIFDELERLGYNEFIVPQAVIDELNSLKRKSKGKDKIASKVALSLVERCNVINIKGNADKIIESLCKDIEADVFTNDIELKEKLIKNGIKVVYLRQRNCLATT